MPGGSLGSLGSRAKTSLTFRRSFLTSQKTSQFHQTSQSQKTSQSHQTSQSQITSQQSATLQRRRTESSILSTSGHDCRPRPLSTNRLERSGRSDSWSSLVVGQSPCRHKSTLATSSHLTTSVDNLCTQYFGRSTAENVDRNNKMDENSVFSDQVKLRNESRQMSSSKYTRRKR